ncbi:flagellar motor protein MotB [Trinickia caryophylli]|uniref:Chemotaxis protein MotB n=1 Tax=Trinickia caryophylli TaxID=28094 RepID=A0A1X7H5Y1_TRICW|nr:flagellar motor protein MotB [Trinickia caryophylli]PMS13312.1 motility protein MotB [Trinickia caryophylli]TRX19159.1 flagellar motor protein MotB [Trinickia caryophylli]WQE13543.1 flagellar motor protein MotB [Trinickia caryophylli]SMF80369.1 chemotaxis protein MotB [Trinickia caryophylli]GLU33923.1 flagellar motor protein MotB [Trinickia caryophylli]
MGDRLSREAAEKRPMSIVVRRSKKGGDHGGHHGGAWKIAYADFVTAMMAFFLLMWLLSSTSKYEKQGIADYFNTPLSALMQGKDTSDTARPSVVQGGGHDLADTRPAVGAMTQPERPTSATTSLAADDLARLQQLKSKLTALIEHVPALNAYKDQIRISITAEGLRIEIVDSQKRPMFASGSTRLEPYAATILTQIGGALNDVENHISIAGHTDDVPYVGGPVGYTNWELSSERANAARRALVAGGMRNEKVLQVRGLADVIPLSGNDSNQPTNRRISILVMNKAAEQAFYRDGGRKDIDDQAQPAGEAIRQAVQPAALRVPAPVAAVAAAGGRMQ